jgi:hypothetical protein
MIELRFLKKSDKTGDLIFKGSDKRKYVMIDKVIHSMSKDGEPDSPVINGRFLIIDESNDRT